MQRRKFLRTAGVGGGAVAAAGTLAAPAIAQSMPELKWRLASSFPKSLDTLFGAGEHFAKRVAAIDRQQVPDPRLRRRRDRARPAGRSTPCRTAPSSAATPPRTTMSARIRPSPSTPRVPFGLNARQHNAWIYYGGGLELMREFYKDYNITSFLCGNTGAQMGGWFRKEIKTPSTTSRA